MSQAYNPQVSITKMAMPILRPIAGTVLLSLTLYATIGFLSQGFSGMAFLGIVAFCICIELVKILFSGDVGFWIALGEPEQALFSAFIVLILSTLSVGSETWFLMSGHLKEMTVMEQSSTRIESLKTQVSDKKAQLAACKPSHLSKCVTPRTAELTALQAELNTALEADAANIEVTAGEKFWIQIAEAVGTTSANLHLGVNLVRSILSELIGVALFSQYGAWRRMKAIEAEAPQMSRRSQRTAPETSLESLPSPQLAPEPKPAARPARPAARPASTVPSRQQLILNHVDTLRNEIAKRDALLAQHRKSAPATAAAPEVTIPAGSVDDKLDALFGSESDSDSVKE